MAGPQERKGTIMESAIGRKYGWRAQNPDRRDLKLRIPARVAKALPPVIDLRGPFMPPVYDQGQLGSCVSNATAAALQYDRRKQGLTDWTPSRLAIYWNGRVIEGTTKSDSGLSIRDGMKSLTRRGYCPEAMWPYRPAKVFTCPPATVAVDEAKRKDEKYQAVAQSEADVCGALAGGLLVVVGFSVYESFESDTVAKTGIVPLPKRAEQLLGGHAVACIGYDTGKQVFLCRNSWGASWAMAGLFTLPFRYLLDPQLASDFWVVQLVAA